MSGGTQPLTSLQIVEDANRCPAGYECIKLTDSGQDADLWKDGWFSTVKRYLCYSRDPRHSDYGTLIVSVQMCAGGERVPTDHEVVATTCDTQKPALKNNLRITYRRLPLVQTSAAITDISLYDQKSILPAKWHCIAMINNLQLAVKQTPKRELEKQNQAGAADGEPSPTAQLQPTSLLEKSQFRSAKMRSQKSYGMADTSYSMPNNYTISPQMAKSQQSVQKVGPLDGLEFSVSKTISTNGPTNKATDLPFMHHTANSFQEYDFSSEMEVLYS